LSLDVIVIQINSIRSVIQTRPSGILLAMNLRLGQLAMQALHHLVKPHAPDALTNAMVIMNILQLSKTLTITV
jgi:hypothetical protein